MLIAFFFVAACIGVADVGSRFVDPPPAPASARVVPDAAAPPATVVARSAGGAPVASESR